MRRVVLALGWIVLAGGLARAEPDAWQGWKKLTRALDEREAAYWDGFQRRLTLVYEDWTGKRKLWSSDPEAYKDEVLPLDDLRALYEDYLVLQRERGSADLALGESGHPRALDVLLDEMLALAKAIEATEVELAEARPTGGGSRYEQQPGVRRHGQAERLRGLEQALAAAAGASAFLAVDGLDRAAKGDKKHGSLRRAAVLDVLGRIGDEGARAALLAALAAPEPFLRIVAVEHLVPAGADLVARLTQRLADPSPAVRRALLETIATRGADVPAWIPVLVAHLPRSRGLERERVLEALEALCGQALGDDVEHWTTWLDGVQATIEAGTFVRPAAPQATQGGEAKEEGAPPPAPPPWPRAAPALTFYGLASPSAHAIFVLDGSDAMCLPAELARQTQSSKSYWLETGPKWRESLLDHRGLLLQQLAVMLESAGADALVALIHLFGTTPGRADVFGDKRLLPVTRSGAKALIKKIEKPPAAGGLSVEEGLRIALAIAGLDPLEDPQEPAATAEVVYVVDRGWNGGRFPLPEVLVEAFARENRFRRLAVLAIRITDEKAEAEKLLQGLAQVSRGAYRWLTELP